ncbi:hypothetical protein UA08_00854 [Talaromyces atroroseus]|uniref:DUF1754-domain-containing protein n=1 Tax=Talaromyces atroroseus TaxID=1441469 RepID=A0A225AU19_TALAT|nr:hypothetical protein UA08_00854 [Talaromyces atroroseus]OKL64430.1 hypothetical protein UA08_00854 [Talaromyces atroroseus]
MAGNEYSAVGGGGKLKLKGSKVKDGRVDKPKKKKKTTSQNLQQQEKVLEGEGEEKEGSQTAKPAENELLLTKNNSAAHGEVDGHDEESDSKRVVYKTEAERKHEEQRRKRLNERLRREGVKTHKERVEELNRYLSTLSEHHDINSKCSQPLTTILARR